MRLTLGVDVDVNKIGTALLHGELLLAEGNERSFISPQSRKAPNSLTQATLRKAKSPTRAKGVSRGADQTFALVEINEYVDFVAGAHTALHVGFGHENFAKGAAVEVGSVVGEADDAQGIIIAYL